jgi:uncharacterized lipoprotein YehR (DUF1307 family)
MSILTELIIASVVVISFALVITRCGQKYEAKTLVKVGG